MKKLLILFCCILCSCLQAQVKYAQIDAQKKVLRVVVVDSVNARSEAGGIQYLKSIFGTATVWVQCFYARENSTRKNFPGPGFTYDIVKNCFIAPKPAGSYSLNPNTCTWDTLKIK